MYVCARACVCVSVHACVCVCVCVICLCVYVCHLSAILLADHAPGPVTCVSVHPGTPPSPVPGGLDLPRGPHVWVDQGQEVWSHSATLDSVCAALRFVGGGGCVPLPAEGLFVIARALCCLLCSRRCPRPPLPSPPSHGLFFPLSLTCPYACTNAPWMCAGGACVTTCVARCPFMCATVSLYVCRLCVRACAPHTTPVTVAVLQRARSPPA